MISAMSNLASMFREPWIAGRGGIDEDGRARKRILRLNYHAHRPQANANCPFDNGVSTKVLHRRSGHFLDRLTSTWRRAVSSATSDVHEQFLQ